MKFSVPNMSCGHCTAAIESAVKTADPQAAVVCDLSKRQVRVDSALTADQLKAAIKDAGYDADPVTA